MMLVLSLALALQVQPELRNYSSPPSGDTLGYWQQRVDYRITATLDESRGVVSGLADLIYVNQSPDTLRELYVHQHLNAFRPGSAWSEVDEREGRVRFQHLADPDYAYERFTAAPTIDGTSVAPQYPGAPDSTVVRFALPRLLPPGDSIRVRFQWDARPSTLPRRQGRRGRSFDLAQWYPRVAVYDRGGWQPNPLVPAGEFYGEFGSYDVTLLLPTDQVVGATGVPVEGDPGWQGALRHGRVFPMADAYRDVVPLSAPAVPAGFKRVRFVARNVHHFAWSTSPDYRYEGGAYVRQSRPSGFSFPTWDTVAVHVLYRPGDEASWGAGIVVERTITALRWLESVYGPYAYPQMTTLHRIEGGGTEFPMVQMNGSPSQGLILHEGGHIFTHGILANNEWRSGWLDEGLSSYQTAWFGRGTPQDRPLLDSIPARPRPSGYRRHAVRPDPMPAARMEQQRLVFVGRAEPLGTHASEFSEFAIYNSAVYTRAEIMYGALREVLGDSAFAAFLRDYYARWAFRHVDERAMRASAERVSGRDLRWFFDQWVHRVGNVDYALDDVDVERRAGGDWLTRVRVERHGDYVHPMPLGVRTRDGWTVVRLDTGETVRLDLPTAAEPLEVRLDPYETTYDWDRRNDSVTGTFGTPGRRQVVFDWPFLEQAASNRTVTAWRPWAMVSSAGGWAFGMRIRSNYQGWIDRTEAGFATSVGLDWEGPETNDAGAWRNLWLSVENPTLWRDAPIVGLRVAGWYVDDALRFDLARSWDASRFITGPRTTRTLAFTAVATDGLEYLPRLDWDDLALYELSFGQVHRLPGPDSATARATIAAGAVDAPGVDPERAGAYARIELEAKAKRPFSRGKTTLAARAFAGYITDDAPRQRLFRLSAQDPLSTFGNHFIRPQGGLLSTLSHYIPLGGGGLHGYRRTVAATDLGAINLEASRLLFAADSTPGALGLWLNLFADAGVAGLAAGNREVLADAGVGFAIRGMLFDQPVRLRLDVPLQIVREDIAVGELGRNSKLRLTLSLNDLW